MGHVRDRLERWARHCAARDRPICLDRNLYQEPDVFVDWLVHDGPDRVHLRFGKVEWISDSSEEVGGSLN